MLRVNCVCQRGTTRYCANFCKESVSLELLPRKVPLSLFPQGYPGSNQVSRHLRGGATALIAFA